MRPLGAEPFPLPDPDPQLLVMRTQRRMMHDCFRTPGHRGRAASRRGVRKRRDVQSCPRGDASREGAKDTRNQGHIPREVARGRASKGIQAAVVSLAEQRWRQGKARLGSTGNVPWPPNFALSRQLMHSPAARNEMHAWVSSSTSSQPNLFRAHAMEWTACWTRLALLPQSVAKQAVHTPHDVQRLRFESYDMELAAAEEKTLPSDSDQTW